MRDGQVSLTKGVKISVVEILSVCGGADGSEPEKIVLFQVISNFDMIYGSSRVLILVDNAGDNGVYICAVKVLQADADAAQNHGFRSGAAVGQGRKNHHGNQQQEGCDTSDYLRDAGTFMLLTFHDSLLALRRQALSGLNVSAQALP